MRSRYCAFALGDEPYLRLTWDRATRPRRIALDPAVMWIGLEIVGSTGGGLLDDEGTVEFRATHTELGSGPGVLHENSLFRRVGGRWLYVTAL
jgi:SEC-C motif-containing protein